METKNEKLEDLILAEYKKGNIVVSTSEGLQKTNLKEFIKQPVEGLLYDLNRNFATILTFIDDPKWVNDYALSSVVVELKRQLDDVSSDNDLLDFAEYCRSTGFLPTYENLNIWKEVVKNK